MKPKLVHSYAQDLKGQEYTERTTSKTCCVDNKHYDFLH